MRRWAQKYKERFSKENPCARGRNDARFYQLVFATVMFHMFGRALVAVVGCALLYMAFFLYEDERGQIQNRLEKMWMSIDDGAREARGRNTAFLREIVRIADSTFDSIFGSRILSWRSIIVSACYSISSYAISCVAGTLSNESLVSSRLLPVRIAFLLGWLAPPVQLFPTHAWKSACIAVIFGLLGSLPTLIPERRVIAWLAMTGLGIGGAFSLVLHADSGARLSFLMLMALLLAVGSDFLLLSADRKLLRWSLSAPRMRGLLAIILVNVLLGLLVLVPQFFLTDLPRKEWEQMTWTVVLLACSANLFTTFIAFLIVLSATTLVLHRLIWPLVARPIYAASQFEVIRNSKLLGSVGITCLLAAFPDSSFLQRLKQLF